MCNKFWRGSTRRHPLLHRRMQLVQFGHQCGRILQTDAEGHAAILIITLRQHLRTRLLHHPHHFVHQGVFEAYGHLPFHRALHHRSLLQCIRRRFLVGGNQPACAQQDATSSAPPRPARRSTRANGFAPGWVCPPCPKVRRHRWHAIPHAPHPTHRHSIRDGRHNTPCGRLSRAPSPRRHSAPARQTTGTCCLSPCKVLRRGFYRLVQIGHGE